MTSGNAPSTQKKKARKTRTTKAPSKTPATRKGGRAAKYDYERLRMMFVEGFPKDPDEPEGDRDWPNLRELSERTNVPYERIRERSARERWIELRQVHQTEIAKSRRKKRVEKLANAAVEFDDKNLDLSKMGIRIVGTRMAEIVREINARAERRKIAEQRLAAGLPVEKFDLYSAIRSSELTDLAKAADIFQNIGMRALGTDVERHAIDITGDVTVEHAVSISAELERDDPDRLAAFMAAAHRAGIFEQLELEAGGLEDPEVEGDGDEDGDIVDAEVVDE
jgi:hypothetical protein